MAINPQHRYDDAITALNIIENVDIIRFVDVKFTPNFIDFKSSNYEETIIESIVITNPIIETNLQGKWKVFPSKYDINLDNFHPWITFNPSTFEGNKINGEIIMDTSKLRMGQIYKRKLILETNSSTKDYILSLKIETGFIKAKNLIYPSLIVLFLIALITGKLSGVMVNFTPNLINWLTFILGLLMGSFGGYGASFSKIDWFVKAVGSVSSLIIIVGFMGLGTDVDLIVGFIIALVVTSMAGMMIKFYLEKIILK